MDADNSGQKNNPDTQSNTLPPHVLKSIEISLKQFENGEGISLEEFKKRHFSKHR